MHQSGNLDSNWYVTNAKLTSNQLKIISGLDSASFERKVQAVQVQLPLVILEEVTCEQR
jgi:hypothetical protein